MENREKLEIPTIEFTPVTLLNGQGASGNCDWKEEVDPNNPGGTIWTQGCKEGVSGSGGWV